LLVRANTHNPTNKLSTRIILASEHSLIAPEGTRFQWHLNNIQIEGATEKILSVTSSVFLQSRINKLPW
jgi:hypothetical protein